MKLIARFLTATTTALTLLSLGAIAQTTYTDTSGTPVNEVATSCAAPLRQSITVGDTGTVGDVDIGLLITHTYRGDLVTFLESPLGTRVQLTANDGGASGQNMNVLFDDSAGTPYTSASTTTDHAATAPPYENTFSPLDTLSSFDGENLNGTWIVEICDFYNADSGDYVRADLTISPAIPEADLSLSVSATVTNPTTGSNTILTYTVTNSGPDATDGITVAAPLPDGLSYVSDTSGGAYNSATGLWTIPGTLGATSTSAIQVTAVANVSGSGAIESEIMSATLPDPDSTPNNMNTQPLEDDTAYETIIINGPPPGTPPTLSCPAPLSTFDWDSNAWTAGALTQSYATGVGFNFVVTGDTGFFQNNAAFGGQNPALSTTLTGGLGGTEQSLHMVVNYTSSTQQVVMTMDVGTPGIGVESLQFSLFDVDINPITSANTHFIDRIQVFGSLGGNAKGSILTPGASNSVSGITATGIAAAASTSADGTVVVTFDTPVDQVVFFYDNDPAVNSNPGQQGISMHDITYCTRGEDFSDAPAAYGTPSHIITPGYRLGATAPDRDASALPSANADGDDTSSTDDENAISIPPLSQGQTTSISVPVTGAGGFLQAWVDWNGDSTFQASEQIATDLQTATSTISVPVIVPVSATTSQTFARLRWSTQSGLGSDGPATDGEVEDYALTVTPNSTPSCPSGLVAVNTPGTATSVVVDAQNGTLALGTPETAGSGANNGNSARVNTFNRTLTLDLGDLVAQNSNLNVYSARDNNAGNITISLSDDNITFTPVTTFNAAPNDIVQETVLTVPTGGAQYIEFQRNGGNVWIAGVSYNDICVTPATLNGTKSTAIYDPLSEGLFAIPGNDMVYTITVTNSGGSVADTDSITLIDALPGTFEFYNDTTPMFGGAVVGWNETSSSLTFNPATDLGFSNGASAPADFASCTYTPSSGYDPAVTYICFNPKGAFAFGDPDPEFSVSFRGRIQ